MGIVKKIYLELLIMKFSIDMDAQGIQLHLFNLKINV